MENKVVRQFNVHEGVATSFGIVLLCWFALFSPWTNQFIYFWGTLSFAIFLIVVLAGHFYPEWTLDVDVRTPTMLGGAVLALVMWGGCWLLSYWGADIFSDTDDQIILLYDLGKGYGSYMLSVMLFLFLGAAEEVFWRGYIQRVLANRWTPTLGYLAATLLYAIVYVWSFNWVLIVGAFCCSAIWGALYRYKPHLLSPLMLSHALFDVLIFVVWPLIPAHVNPIL